MILNVASALLLTLGICSAWLARPTDTRSETFTATGEYLGGLLIISGLALLGWHLGRVIDFATAVRF